MTIDKRRAARELAAEAIAKGEPLSWFEKLYAGSRADGLVVPWADREVNPNLVALYERTSGLPAQGRALKVGCGIGDDAEWLAAKGFDVTAFDIAPSAILDCRERFPNSHVHYEARDLFKAQESWNGAFDLVVESYTLQVLPPELRQKALRKIFGFVAPLGSLLLICRARDESDSPGTMPWPLTRHELAIAHELQFEENLFEDFLDNEDPPVRRFRAWYRRR